MIVINYNKSKTLRKSSYEIAFFSYRDFQKNKDKILFSREKLSRIGFKLAIHEIFRVRNEFFLVFFL